MTPHSASDYLTCFEALLEQNIFALPAKDKKKLLLPVLTALHEHHKRHCVEYRNIVGETPLAANSATSLPYLAVRLFKQFSLSSVAQDEIFRVLQSSGTTGQVPARVVLDKATSARQSKALVKIMQSVLGKQRLPMLIIDSPSVLSDKALSARAAGIQGLAFFGRKPVYALNDDMSLNLEAIQAFQAQHSKTPVLLFGFTFMVWEYFVHALRVNNLNLHLPHGKLIHSGGWKKLAHKQVSNRTFKAELNQLCGITQVHNFYGMAEQVGTVFLECEKGVLHAPLLADIIIRDPYTLAEQTMGEPGLIQVLSSIPSSYPGFSLLTEDLGRILGEDSCSCGRKGKFFEVLGRLPKAEVRGCSDTQV